MSRRLFQFPSYNGQCPHQRRQFVGTTGTGNTRWHCYDCGAWFAIDYEASKKLPNVRSRTFRAIERPLPIFDQRASRHLVADEELGLPLTEVFRKLDLEEADD